MRSAAGRGRAENAEKGALLVGILAPYQNEKLIAHLASAGIDAFAMDIVLTTER